MKYQVWREGFGDMGGNQPATFLGEYEAESFRSAVQQAAWKHGFTFQTHPDGMMTDYCCRFFDDEANARKRFG